MNKNHINSDWSKDKFKNVATIVMGQSPPGDSYNQEGKGTPLINGPVEFTQRYPIKRQWTMQPSRSCVPGDILFCVRGSSTGRINIANDHYCIGRGVAAIRAMDGKTTISFIEHELNYFLESFLKFANGSTFPSIDKETLGNIEFLLPPLPEQKRIASILNAWDRAIDQTEKLLAAKRQLKKGLMQKLLTGMVRLKEFAGRKWKTYEFGELTSLRKDKYDPQTDVQSFKCVELEYIAQEKGQLLGWVDSKQQSCVKNIFLKGDILFGKLRPYLKKYYQAEFDGVCSTEIWVLRGRNNLCLNEYLYYLVQTNDFLQVANVSSGTQMPRSDWGHVSEQTFRIPSTDEQKRIANILGTFDEEIDLLEKRLEVIKFQKKGLMQQLLTGKIRVKV